MPAGVFTQPYATQLVLLALEEATEKGIIDEKDVTQDHIEGFLSVFGRRFYKLPEPVQPREWIALKRIDEVIPESIKTADGSLAIGLSRSGATVFSVRFATD